MTGRLEWRSRPEPLTCAAVAATAHVTDRLIAAARRQVVAGASLRAVADESWIVFLGQPGDLPWADGAVYLGWDGGLLVPTALTPSIPPDLLRRSLGRPVDEIVAVLPGAILFGPAPTTSLDAAALRTP